MKDRQVTVTATEADEGGKEIGIAVSCTHSEALLLLITGIRMLDREAGVGPTKERWESLFPFYERAAKSEGLES